MVWTNSSWTNDFPSLGVFFALAPCSESGLEEPSEAVVDEVDEDGVGPGVVLFLLGGMLFKRENTFYKNC